MPFKTSKPKSRAGMAPNSTAQRAIDDASAVHGYTSDFVMGSDSEGSSAGSSEHGHSDIFTEHSKQPGAVAPQQVATDCELCLALEEEFERVCSMTTVDGPQYLEVQIKRVQHMEDHGKAVAPFTTQFTSIQQGLQKAYEENTEQELSEEEAPQASDDTLFDLDSCTEEQLDDQGKPAEKLS